MNILSVLAPKGAFFRRIDWAAFWTATLASMLVYFFTLPPSVTLEDAGEFIVAGDHWGVPHPPGYPIWTFFANIFSDVFAWVTFRGQPTPAWSIALFSAVCGALAAGITAMLITRSSSDILKDFRASESGEREASHDVICWAGGVAGSLLFAFSPVMWSQSVIVEAYALNALLLMWVFLLTYRWMRRPSEKILWLAAYVFGLGLTNYQVLLLAAVPLAVVILLRDICLFRDFMFAAVPFGLSLLTLKVGAILSDPALEKLNLPAQARMAGVDEAAIRMSYQGINGAIRLAPNNTLVVAGVVLFLIGLTAALVMEALARRGNARAEQLKLPVIASVLGAGVVALFLSLVFKGTAELSAVRLFATPPVHPSVFVKAGMWAMLAAGALVVAALARPGRKWGDPWVGGALGVAGFGFVAMLVCVGSSQGGIVVPRVPPPGLENIVGEYFGTLFKLKLAFFLGAVLMVGLSLFTKRGLMYTLAVLVVQGAWLGLVNNGMAFGLVHPSTWWFWFPIAWNFILLGLIWLLLPNGRQVALTIFFAELGVAFYVYMPIASDLNNPPMNWGYPRTWEGFKHALMRGQYEQIIPLNPLASAENFKAFLKQVGSYFTDLRTQFTLLVVPLSLLPFALWSVRTAKNLRFRLLYLAAGFYAVAALLVVVGRYTLLDEMVRLDKFVLVPLALIAVAGFLIFGVIELVNLCKRLYAAATTAIAEKDMRTLTGLVLVSGGIGFIVVYAVGRLAEHAPGKTTDPDDGDPDDQFPLVPEVRTNIDAVGRQWLLATMLGFLVMSVLLIILANPKGDLQDTFIQKVKFISSHGLFTLWVGYGLVLGLVVGEHLLKLLRGMLPKAAVTALRFCMICAVLLSACIPIYENYTNEDLIHEFGSAEQNGHDYGWQFGNYQLRGADAITEELDDEEPLPDPTFPPEMEQDAIFFGGTDPGRFVPTYMIYSAYVRPDVFLITQNALADQTYMNIMRDLMGNDIWMPTPDDSSRAFTMYVDDVREGRRPPAPGMITEGGRIQVQGALAVMEINGILCDMIFTQNKARHAFYVEESYPINWMYDYFTPHGLIMKLNPEKTRIPREVLQQDMDFWDWYVRRLTRDRKYRRDFVAQKSFSKLRTSIGGLYRAQRFYREAEETYQQARLLYPPSPEANFRIVQEIHLPMNRIENALDTMAELSRLDPRNERVKEFAEALETQLKTKDRVDALKESLKNLARDKWNPMDLLELSELCMAVNPGEAMQYAVQMMALTNVPPGLLCRAASLLSRGGRHEDAVRTFDKAMQTYGNRIPPEAGEIGAKVYFDAKLYPKAVSFLEATIANNPKDWGAMIQLAAARYNMQQMRQARQALERAVQVGGENALKNIDANPQLRELYENARRNQPAFRF